MTSTTTRFKAFRIHNDDDGYRATIDEIGLDALDAGDVVIRAEWSDINYKDALAGTGKGKIVRRFPMVGGIDVAGTVESSSDARFAPGDAVVVTGCGLSEEHDGGYAEFVRVPADWVVKAPNGLDARTCMALGTAGFTAAMAVDRMEANGLAPGNGPVFVNGATGGVGSIAIDMLAGRGYDVTAYTGKAAQREYLESLGAAKVEIRGELEMGTRALEKSLWAGAVDSVGGDELGWLTRTMQHGGTIASIGLAGGIKLESTVMPFILRGVSLLGINSVYVTSATRAHIWARMAGDLAPRHLEQIVNGEVALADLGSAFDGYMAGTITGRKLVRVA